MFDEQLRTSARGAYRPFVSVLVRTGATADVITAVGLVLGAGCLAAVATGHHVVGLVLWLANRLCDGFDGEVARARGTSSERGAFVDIVADFVMYGGLVLALAVQHPEARLALVAVLCAFYLNGCVFLALSSTLERLRRQRDTDRGLHFRRSLAEGFETIVAGVVWLALPQFLSITAWAFASLVCVSALLRVVDGCRLLRSPA